jgi:hypothetical protein
MMQDIFICKTSSAGCACRPFPHLDSNHPILQTSTVLDLMLAVKDNSTEEQRRQSWIYKSHEPDSNHHNYWICQLTVTLVESHQSNHTFSIDTHRRLPYQTIGSRGSYLRLGIVKWNYTKTAALTFNAFRCVLVRVLCIHWSSSHLIREKIDVQKLMLAYVNWYLQFQREFTCQQYVSSVNSHKQLLVLSRCIQLSVHKALALCLVLTTMNVEELDTSVPLFDRTSQTPLPCSCNHMHIVFIPIYLSTVTISPAVELEHELFHHIFTSLSYSSLPCQTPPTLVYLDMVVMGIMKNQHNWCQREYDGWGTYHQYCACDDCFMPRIKTTLNIAELNHIRHPLAHVAESWSYISILWH